MRYMKCGTQPASASTQTTRKPGLRSNTPPNTSVPMMSWFARMMVMKAFAFGPRGRPWPRLVRMCHDTGKLRSTAACQKGSHWGSSKSNSV